MKRRTAAIASAASLAAGVGVGMAVDPAPEPFAYDELTVVFPTREGGASGRRAQVSVWVGSTSDPGGERIVVWADETRPVHLHDVDPTGNPDLDGDGDVDATDMGVLLSAWGGG